MQIGLVHKFLPSIGIIKNVITNSQMVNLPSAALGSLLPNYQKTHHYAVHLMASKMSSRMSVTLFAWHAYIWASLNRANKKLSALSCGKTHVAEEYCLSIKSIIGTLPHVRQRTTALHAAFNFIQGQPTEVTRPPSRAVPPLLPGESQQTNIEQYMST